MGDIKEFKMKTVDKKIKGNFPIRLLSDDSGKGFNVLSLYVGEGRIYTHYHFPIMVKEKMAREQYSQLTN